MFELIDRSLKNSILTETLNSFYSSCIKGSISPKKSQDRVIFSQNHILKVDKPFKLFLTNLGQSQGVCILSVNEYHPELSQIRIKYLNQISETNERGFLIKFTLKTNQKLYFYINEKLEFCNQITLLQNLIPDQERENILPKKQRQLAKPFPLEAWGTDNFQDWEANVRHQNAYKEIYDPMILENLKTFVLPRVKEKKELIIMDIGGGKGRLAEKIIHLVQENNIKLYYVLLEPIASQVAIAKDRFANLKKLYQDDIVTQIFTSTLDYFSKQECYPLYQGSIDCIISCGGPLNKSVVSQDDAKKNLHIMQSLLAEGGRIIANGLSSLLVTRKDFYQCGLTMFSMSKKMDTGENIVIMQNYVAGK